MGKGGNPNFLTLETKEKNVKSYNVEEKQSIPVKSVSVYFFLNE